MQAWRSAQQPAGAAACFSGRGSSKAPTAPRAARRQRTLHVAALLKPAEGVAVSWSQSTDDVTIRVPVAADVRGRDVAFEVHPTRLSLAVRGATLLAGSLVDAGAIKADDSYWVLESDEGPGGRKEVVISLAKGMMGYQSWPHLLEADLPDTTITHRVALDVAVGKRVGRLVLGLYGKVVPRTVANFVALVTGEAGSGRAGVRLALEGSGFHRIIPGFMAQGGDITAGDGTGGESIYGPSFEDENFKLSHSGRGVLAMANAGPNTNSSQFYITFTPTPHLDGKHVVLGTVEAGWSTLMMIESAGSEDGAPSCPVSIRTCRLMGLDDDPQAAVDELSGSQMDALLEEELGGGGGGGEQEEGGAASDAAQQQQQQQQQVVS